MFKVTSVEKQAVEGLEGIYTSLRASAEKVSRTLFYDLPISTDSAKGVFGFVKGFFKKKSTTVTKKDLIALLEVLNILQEEFEISMPLVVDGKLYFKFRCFDGHEHNNHTYKIGEAQDGYDLIACFQALEERITRVLATPEVAHVVKNPCFHSYCSSLAKENLGISSLHKAYLKNLKEAVKNFSKNQSTSEPPVMVVTKQRKGIHKNAQKKCKKGRKLPRMKK